MDQERDARARAKRDYLISGAIVLAAAVIGIVDQGAFSGARCWLVAAAIVVAAAVFFGVTRVFFRREEDDDAAPTVERMRKMAFIWLILAAVLGAGVLRAPAAALFEAGVAGPRPRDWAAAAAGLAIVVAACARAVLSLRGWIANKREGG